MLTATKDLMLPTTVTGSWPRPTWYTGNLFERPYSTGLADVDYREQHLDAVATVISTRSSPASTSSRTATTTSTSTSAAARGSRIRASA